MSFIPLLEQSELAGIREIGESGMQTEVQIWRSSITPEDPVGVGYDPESDYGDDEVGNAIDMPEPTDGTGALVAQVWGWFFSQLQMNDEAGAGQLVTLDIHILRVPVGTDIRPLDFVVRVDNSSRYTVIDTNNDDTFPEWEKVSLRRRE